MKSDKLNESLGLEGNPGHINALGAAAGLKEKPGLHEVFFKPDNDFVDWIIEYANNRVIVEVGCGSCHFLNLINRTYKSVLGIEPQFDISRYMSVAMSFNREPMHIAPMRVERCEGLIQGLEDKALIILARPSHSGMVEATIEVVGDGQEILYITKPENIIRYNDLGKYENNFSLINHKGSGQKDEKVWAFTK